MSTVASMAVHTTAPLKANLNAYFFLMQAVTLIDEFILIVMMFFFSLALRCSSRVQLPQLL